MLNAWFIKMIYLWSPRLIGILINLEVDKQKTIGKHRQPTPSIFSTMADLVDDMNRWQHHTITHF